MDGIDEFHAHLDVCRQCRDNPYGLCWAGERLLLRAVVMPVMDSGITPAPADVCPEGGEHDWFNKTFPGCTQGTACRKCGTRR